MAEARRARFQFFDREQELSIRERHLPHWMQAGTLTFITWRTWDSLPESVVHGWLQARAADLRAHGIDPDDRDWTAKLHRLPAEKANRLRDQFSDRWHEQLDRCHGDCVLRRRECSRIVADSLKHFDGKRYVLTDYVIMPNHVHLLAAFADEGAMLSQCESWKRYTGNQINRLLQRTGRFWQQEAFDHLVRSEEQFLYYRDYIAQNPGRAKLSAGEYWHESQDLNLPPGR